MAQFRGTLITARGAVVSRLGGKGLGLTVTADGWNTGVWVELQHVDGRDRVTILRTGGSSGGPREVVAVWEDAMDKSGAPS